MTVGLPTQIPGTATRRDRPDIRPDRMSNSPLYWLLLPAATAGSLFLAWLPVDRFLQGVLAAVLIAMLLVLRRHPHLGWLRLTFVGISGFLTARYFFWRTFQTLGYDDPASFVAALALYGAECYGILMFGFSAFVNARPIRRQPVGTVTAWPSVDVFVPTYDEPVEVVKATLVAATAMDYPGAFQVHLLDDGGTWEKCHDPDPLKAARARERARALRELCAATGARYLTRRDNRHAKAGNLNAALTRTSGELVLVLDCDHIPTVDFLRHTAAHFAADERLFLVQTPHFFVTPDPIEKNLALFNRMPAENDMFYEAIQPGLDFWESSFFCGSAALLRRQALEEIGGFSGISVTEDAETALSLHERGWRSRYLLKPMISGLQPETFTSFVKQRIRWAQGTVQLFLLKNPLRLKGLRLWQKLSYLNCMLFWFFPFARVVFLLAPLCYLYFGLHIYDAGIRDIAAYTLPYLLALTLNANYLFGRVRWFLISEIYETMQSLFSLPAVFDTLRHPHKPRFTVTPKGEQLYDDFISPLARPFYLLILLTLGGLVSGWLRWQAFPEQRPLTSITLLWAGFNLIILIAALGALYERRQRRHTPRLPADDMTATLLIGGKALQARIQDFSIGGAALKVKGTASLERKSAILELTHPVYNRVWRIAATVVTCIPGEKEGTLIGIHFLPKSLADYRDIVLLVHGDSRRWERILQRRDRDIGILRAFLVLMGQAFRQSQEHFKALLTGVAPRRRGWAVPGLALGLLLMAFSVSAQTGGRITLPLAKMMTRPERIILRHTSDDYTLHFPLSPRHQPKSVHLHLDFTHSNALISSRSQLRVQVNGITIGQRHLSPPDTHKIVDLAIPPELLVAGYNELRFRVTQHYTEAHCEDPTSPELWTEIDTVHSHLSLEWRPRSLAPRLSDLGRLIDPKIPAYRFRLLLPNAELGDEQLQWGGLIAQGVALKRDYAPFELALARPEPAQSDGTTLRMNPPGDDAALVGTRQQLRPFLSESLYRAIQGPYLGIFPAPGQREHFVLVVSGASSEEVKQAAAAFALSNFPLPDTAATQIRRIQTSPPEPYAAIPAVEADTAYRFAQLGFTTREARRLSPEPLEFTFFVPADWYAPETAEVTLHLHLAYNAGLRRDSLLEMRINGVFERAIQLPEESGAHYRDYRLTFPLRALKPGLNRITFHPYLVPAISGECRFFRTDHLAVTLYDDSTIHFPPVGHYVQLPDLQRFAATGFPYLERGEAPVIQVLDPSPDSILAAWQLLGRLARINGMPLLQARISFRPPEDDAHHLIVVGRLDHLNDELLRAAPIDPTARWKEWAYPAGWTPTGSEDWQTRLQRRLIGVGQPPVALEPRHIRIAQSGGLGDFAMGLSFGAGKRLITVFTARESLYPALQALTTTGLWSQMQGDLILWRSDAKTLFWQRLGSTFHLGDAGPSLRLIFHFAQHPWQWLAVVIGLILLLAWTAHRLLQHFKRRHHPDAEEIAP